MKAFIVWENEISILQASEDFLKFFRNDRETKACKRVRKLQGDVDLQYSMRRMSRRKLHFGDRFVRQSDSTTDGQCASPNV